jgi:hypothetical protein
MALVWVWLSRGLPCQARTIPAEQWVERDTLYLGLLQRPSDGRQRSWSTKRGYCGHIRIAQRERGVSSPTMSVLFGRASTPGIRPSQMRAILEEHEAAGSACG